MAHGRFVTAIVVILGLMLMPLGVTGDATTTLSIEAPAEVAPGGEFIARVAVDHVQDFGGCSFYLAYDQTVITVTDVTDGEIGGHAIPVGVWAFFPADVGDPGRIRVLSVTPGVPGPGVTGAGYLAEIHFRVVGAGGTGSDIILEHAGMSDYEVNEIPLTIVHGAVTVASSPTDLQITTTALPDATPGQAYSTTLAASGGKAPYSWTATGLPTGLTCSAAGVISGSPAQSGDFSVTVIVTDDAAASQSTVLALKVEEVAAALEITTTGLHDGEPGHAYTATLAAAGGTPPYTWQATGLPDGLTCSEDGVVSGTPAEPGDFTVTVTVTDSAAASESKTLELKVEVEAALEIVTTELPDGDIDQGYTATLEAVGGAPPYTWQATGLPDGLTCSEDGVISGTPAESGDFTVTVTVTDSAAASESKGLAAKIHRTPEEPTIAFTPRSFSLSATEGEADPTGGTLEIWNSGPGTVDWSVSGDAQWLSLSPSSGTSAGERNSVTVSVDIAGMSAGDYSAIMTIAAPGAANSPRTVNVSLEIGADSGTPVDDNDRPPARPPLFVLWIALGAVAIAVVIVLVLKRHTV